MNTIKVKVNFTQGTCETTGINLVTGDYNSTKLVFEFDREDGTKVFEMKSPSEELCMVQEIQNNEIILYGEDENENIASIFTEEGYYVFEISLYENESKLTSAKGKLKVKPEQVVIDGEVVEAYLPIFDQLLSEVSTALAETDNLNIEGSKSGTTTTITLTYKDGTTQTLQVLDGEQGPQGERGPAGVIRIIICPNGLPETGEEGPLYEVPKEEPTTQDLYDEYMWVDNKWELMGEKKIAIDLTDYVKNTDYATSSKGGVIKTSDNLATGMASGQLYAQTKTFAQYSSANVYDNAFIGKATLENVITGKGLTTKSYVDGLVGDINTAIDSINGEVI